MRRGPRTYFLEDDALVVARGKRAWIVEFRGRRARFAHLDEAIRCAVGVDESGATFLAQQILQRGGGVQLVPPKR